MNIVFMGTPDFSVPSLEILLKSKHKISAVVTAPDKQKGRGRKITSTAVKECAIKNNIQILQPNNLKDENFINESKKINADLYVVVAFRILPKEVFTIPKYGSFNLHGSLLPKYRGAAPIQWAIMKGETETGVTTFSLAEKVDTGSIYLQEKIIINAEDDFGSLHDKMSLVGAKVILETVNLIESGKYLLKYQDDSLASPAPKITKETALINWKNSAKNIQNLIRGLSPFPGAFFIHNKKIIKIFKSEILNRSNLTPSKILQTKTELFIGCGEGSLKILELQKEGSKRMKTEEFLRGFSF
ncbi:MAG: methionyl-tRNA formyltransferase [Ignavibacteriales bacterium CG_4_9_14_3_um_filter_30_11]|nr:MAG: methionyl-tRNA formyltransferase [Ignavibacteriales bacterium CG_4_9_14_3_um_filter_30_11]